MLRFQRLLQEIVRIPVRLDTAAQNVGGNAVLIVQNLRGDSLEGMTRPETQYVDRPPLLAVIGLEAPDAVPVFEAEDLPAEHKTCAHHRQQGHKECNFSFSSGQYNHPSDSPVPCGFPLPQLERKIQKVLRPEFRAILPEDEGCSDKPCGKQYLKRQVLSREQSAQILSPAIFRKIHNKQQEQCGQQDIPLIDAQAKVIDRTVENIPRIKRREHQQQVSECVTYRLRAEENPRKRNETEYERLPEQVEAEAFRPDF